MESVKIILEFIGKLLWPATVITIVLLFRKYLIQLIPNIKTLKAGGIELTVERVQEIAKATIEVVNEKAPELKFQEDLSDTGIQSSQGNRDRASTMLAFAAGRSYTENMKYSIYYDPASRNHSLPFDYVGLYINGAICAVGRISKIVYCDLEDGELVSTNEDDLGRLTNEEYKRIKSIMEETKYYDIKEGCKFFLIDKFYETHLVWDTVIRGKQYVWLYEFEGFEPGMGAQELAQLLRRISIN